MNQIRLAGDGVVLAATAYGDQRWPPVVLLHGGGQTRHAWGTAGRALADHGWYAISIDLRGHGESGWSPDGVYSMDAFARDVRAVCRSLAPRPALIGASLGGLASLVAIGQSDEPLARALVLVDVTPRSAPVVTTSTSGSGT